jgi:hypothetical protein
VATDPTVSAIVELEGAAPGAGSDAGSGEAAGPPRDLATIAKTKSYFTTAGFEVHAPLGMSFSIAAKRSHFEEYFGQKLAIDDEDLFGAVTTEAGDAVLPLDPIPDDIRPMIRAVSFPPPPDLGPH